MCGLLRCSFRLGWAMQEPWFVGRATGTATHTFLYHVPNYHLFMNLQGWVAAWVNETFMIKNVITQFENHQDFYSKGEGFIKVTCESTGDPNDINVAIRAACEQLSKADTGSPKIREIKNSGVFNERNTYYENGKLEIIFFAELYNKDR